MRSSGEFELDRPFPIIAGQSLAQCAGNTARRTSVRQGHRQLAGLTAVTRAAATITAFATVGTTLASSTDKRRRNLDESRVLHGLEHLPALNVDEAELAVTDRATGIDDGTWSRLVPSPLNVGEPDRSHAG
ncbi:MULTISPECIES: hypothetical protein [unclassified Brevibacterium]|uniref:hypothetical protein n=1 Tax=unclassified Brevibacterium TaxID=2614124 RepID=UPI001F0D7EC3|nr:hypothetical protein [Brevibacterium sp. S22]